MAHPKLAYLIFLPFGLVTAIPITCFAVTTFFCSLIYLITITTIRYFAELFSYAQSELVSKIISALSSGDTSGLGEAQIFSVSPFQTLNNIPRNRESSDFGRSRRHSRRSSFSSRKGSQDRRTQHPDPRAGYPFASRSRQASPQAYRSTSANNIGIGLVGDGEEWEDVDDNLESSKGATRQHKPVSSESLRENFFVGQYEGDVDGVLPTGPRLQFDLPPHPKRSRSFGMEADSPEIREY